MTNAPLWSPSAERVAGANLHRLFARTAADHGLQYSGDPVADYVQQRTEETHDLWHVLTGYGRDTFGEACLLAFSYAQTGNRGIGLIALGGILAVRR